MNGSIRRAAAFPLAISLVYLFSTTVLSEAQSKTRATPSEKVIAEADCTVGKLGATIPVSAIGEPVSGVTLNAPVWKGAAGANPAYCSVDGSMAPVDTAANAKPINFRVVLPASWSHRAVQLGGGGMNGMIPNLVGGVDMRPGTSLIQLGFVTYGSDSGHQMAFGLGFGRGRSGGSGRREAGRPVDHRECNSGSKPIRRSYKERQPTHNSDHRRDY
jgi:hypothetical protein